MPYSPSSYGDDPHDDWDDDAETEDFDSEVDDDSDDEEVALPCPYCREEIHEDAQQCPHCGNYLSAEDAPSRRQPAWVVAIVLLCLMAVLGWIFRGL